MRRIRCGPMAVGRNLLVKLCVAMGVVALPLLVVILGFVLPQLREQLRADRILGLSRRWRRPTACWRSTRPVSGRAR